MPNKLEMQAWQLKAEEDWACIHRLLDDPYPLVFPAIFHLQQACEKWLKLFFIAQGVAPPKTHDHGLMIERLQLAQPSLTEYLELADALNPFAVQFRYPGDLPEISISEARRLVERGADLRNLVKITLFF